MLSEIEVLCNTRATLLKGLSSIIRKKRLSCITYNYNCNICEFYHKGKCELNIAKYSTMRQITEIDNKLLVIRDIGVKRNEV